MKSRKVGMRRVPSVKNVLPEMGEVAALELPYQNSGWRPSEKFI
jgi:hypothetical protein